MAWSVTWGPRTTTGVRGLSPSAPRKRGRRILSDDRQTCFCTSPEERTSKIRSGVRKPENRSADAGRGGVRPAGRKKGLRSVERPGNLAEEGHGRGLGVVGGAGKGFVSSH